MIKKIVIAFFLCAQIPIAAMHQQAAMPPAKGGAAAAAAQQQAVVELSPEDKLDDAIDREDDEEIETLIAAGGSRLLNGSKIFGAVSPLLYAVSVGKLKAVKKLVSLYASARGSDDNWNNLIHLAAFVNNPAMIEYVWKLPRVHDLREAKNRDGLTPLLYAATEGKTEAVQKLLELGADVNALDFDGNTLLHCAAYSDSKSLIKFVWDWVPARGQRRTPNNHGQWFYVPALNESRFNIFKDMLLYGGYAPEFIFKMVPLEKLLTCSIANAGATIQSPGGGWWSSSYRLATTHHRRRIRAWHN